MSGSGPLREDAPSDAKSDALHSKSKQISTLFPSVPLISSSQLKLLMDDPHRRSTLCLVDVRTPEEVAVSTLPGALTVPEFESRRSEFAGRTVVCYCTVGYRSSGHAGKLMKQGVEAKNLEGGIVRWTQKRYPLVSRVPGADGSSSQEVETKRVHVYGPTWALQPDDYEAVVFKSPVLSGISRLLPSWLGGKK